MSRHAIILNLEFRFFGKLVPESDFDFGSKIFSRLIASSAFISSAPNSFICFRSARGQGVLVCVLSLIHVKLA